MFYFKQTIRTFTGQFLMATAKRKDRLYIFDRSQNYAEVPCPGGHSQRVCSARFIECNDRIHVASSGADNALIIREARKVHLSQGSVFLLLIHKTFRINVCLVSFWPWVTWPYLVHTKERCSINGLAHYEQYFMNTYPMYQPNGLGVWFPVRAPPALWQPTPTDRS